MSYIPPSDSLKVLNASGVTINPATDESVLLLRRMVKLLDSIATVDIQNRQRVAVETMPTVTVTHLAYSSLLATVTQPTASLLNVTPIQSSSSQLNANVFFGGIDPRYQFIDAARIAYATGVRANLKFT